MSLRIISVGKKHEPWISDSIERYQKRLRAPFDVEWVFLPSSGFDEPRSRQNESERILSRLSPDDYVILLDEIGKELTSPQLASTLEKQFTYSSITFVIGGAYGVNEAMQQRANLVWSLSPLVFPHQLVRLILIEQLYRAQQISRGGSYHHE